MSGYTPVRVDQLRAIVEGAELLGSWIPEYMAAEILHLRDLLRWRKWDEEPPTPGQFGIWRVVLPPAAVAATAKDTAWKDTAWGWLPGRGPVHTEHAHWLPIEPPEDTCHDES